VKEGQYEEPEALHGLAEGVASRVEVLDLLQAVSQRTREIAQDVADRAVAKTGSTGWRGSSDAIVTQNPRLNREKLVNL
jgi:hypothetical protein